MIFALLSCILPSVENPLKVSIIPREKGMLGFSQSEVSEEHLYSKKKMEELIIVLMGGRVCEEYFCGDVTNGASNDIERATALARSMVTKWGLSNKMGPLAYAEEENEVFLGKSVSQQKTVSDETAHTIDSEIRHIIDVQYKRATKLIKDNMEKMHIMADALMKYETIDAKQIDEIMDGKILGTPSSLDFLLFFLYFCSSQSSLLILSFNNTDFSKTCGCLSINFSFISCITSFISKSLFSDAI